MFPEEGWRGFAPCRGIVDAYRAACGPNQTRGGMFVVDHHLIVTSLGIVKGLRNSEDRTAG